MSDNEKPDANIGAIEWCDLTVDDAENVKDFYCSVVGWDYRAASMGDYDDYGINLPESSETIAGICHARGANSNLPAQWLMYVRVANVAASAKRCEELGGTVLDGPRALGQSQFCVIRDPAGAVLALVSD